ncbi:SDR family NAD(P)-dependent oxidoreductase [Vibrio maerlii]|uniref:SDR family NAD(P)-dependent oxidoreductase n=1 Tax=Vibrio maerlii TaxID=2231648 RepID=UPI000E3E34B4|nr:SDR family NAD(P)-dependent oxidoreductase [Vibrio maerlii]
MQKVILLTGSTDGIGFETAKMLVNEGHEVLLHGRSQAKLDKVQQELASISNATTKTFVADLSNLDDVRALSANIKEQYTSIDVIINNAGVYNTPTPVLANGQDIRFVVNTLAPYLLTKELLPLMSESGRVVNLSSAAQGTVSIDALLGNKRLGDGDAYAQSKLAITMWSRVVGEELKGSGPLVVSVNPKSLLGSKMVKDAYGIAGGDLTIGADILFRATLSDEFNGRHGAYFDNDIGAFARPHPDALNDAKCREVIDTIEKLIA